MLICSSSFYPRLLILDFSYSPLDSEYRWWFFASIYSCRSAGRPQTRWDDNLVTLPVQLIVNTHWIHSIQQLQGVAQPPAFGNAAHMYSDIFVVHHLPSTSWWYSNAMALCHPESACWPQWLGNHNAKDEIAAWPCIAIACCCTMGTPVETHQCTLMILVTLLMILGKHLLFNRN